MDAMISEVEDIDCDSQNALELLRSIYQNPSLALSIRMRAAAIALPFESPKLAVVAQVTENSFAELLERRLKRLQEMEANPVIEAKSQPQTVEVKPPMPRLADRRYRRL